MKAKRKPKFREGQRVKIVGLKATIIELNHKAGVVITRAGLFQKVICYPEEIRALTKREAGRD